MHSKFFRNKLLFIWYLNEIVVNEIVVKWVVKREVNYWLGFAKRIDVTNSCNDFGQGLFTNRIISSNAVFFLLLSSRERIRTSFDSSLYFGFCSSVHTRSSVEIPLEVKKGITNWLRVRSRSHCEFDSSICSTNFTSHLEWSKNSLNCLVAVINETSFKMNYHNVCKTTMPGM